MAQALHSLLPGHMGPDVEVPTLRGGDTDILQLNTMSKAFFKTSISIFHAIIITSDSIMLQMSLVTC